MMEFTGERFVPEVKGIIELEHLHRYLHACELVSGKDVLDIASGEGYGSAMLATKAKKVIGIDISLDAVKHANRRYIKENLKYMVGSCASIPLPDSCVDAIVSFETIEHHDQHDKMMQEFKRILRPDGFLLISSPDRYYYSDEVGFDNVFHIKELYEHELKQLLRNYFRSVSYFGQRIVYGSAIFAEELSTPILDFWKEGESCMQQAGIARPVYWIAIASDVANPTFASGIFEQTFEESEHIQSLRSEVRTRDGLVENLKRAVIERDRHIEQISQNADECVKVLAERDRQLAELNQATVERDERIANLTSAIVAIHEQHALLACASRVYKAVLWLGGQLTTALRHPSQPYQIVKDILTIRHSPLFNSSHYLSTYLDVCVSGCNPIRHYCEFGWKEGRNPSPDFNTNLYLESNPDVVAHGLNPLAHYIRHGRLENRYPEQANIQNLSLSAAIAENCLELPPNLCLRAELMSQSSDDIHRVLVIDYAVPTPDMDSGSVRMFGILQLIAKLGSALTFAANKSESDSKYITALKELKIDLLLGYDDILTHLAQCGSRYAVVIISRPEIAEKYMTAVRTYAAQAELDYDTVDLHYLRFKRGSEISANAELAAKADQYYQLEMLCCNSADRVFAVTEIEKKAILQNWPNSRVEIMPNIHSINVSPQPWSTRHGLVFIGSYNHQPNVDAVLWFVQDILPIIKKAIPEITFTILGSNPPEEVKSVGSSNVIVLGWVPEPEIYFSSARVFVAPLRYGAGMKGKIGQAMSVGLPVVTTTIGAEGMGLMDNVHALIADDQKDFALAVIQLYKNEALWKKTQQEAVSHIERNFSEAAVKNVLSHIWPNQEQR